MNIGSITLKRSFVVALLAVALGLGFETPARGGTGDYEPRPAECLQNHIVLPAPSMFPEPVMSSPGWAIIGGNSQVVSFRPHLAQYFPAAGWRTVQSGTWKRSSVGDVNLAVFSWTTLDGRPVDARHYFPITSVGTQTAPVYYAAFIEYRWHSDATHTGGSTSDWVPHLESRGSAWNQKTYWGCKYPGPNDVRMIG